MERSSKAPMHRPPRPPAAPVAASPPAPPRTRRGERGIALLIVLVLMLILVPFSVEFAIQVQLESRTAQNVVDQLALENAIDGQFEIALARLQHDGEQDEVDSLFDDWNSDELKERREEDTEVAISTRVFDEQGKFNILLLVRAPADRRVQVKERLARILVEARRDSKEPIDEGLAKELVEDAAAFLSGAKARGNIPKPSTPDDRGFLMLEDLAFANVKWRALLQDSRDGDVVSPGLGRFLTIYGNGKVNLNTADAVVLKAFFPSDPSIADRIIERRNGEEDEESSAAAGQGAAPTTGGPGSGSTGSGSTGSGSTGSGSTGSGSTGSGSSATGSGSSSEDDSEQGNPFTSVDQVMQVEGVDPQTIQKDKVDLAADFDVKSAFFSLRILAESTGTRRDELYVVERVRGQAQAGAQQPASVEGFRHHLHQERTDALEDLATTR